MKKEKINRRYQLNSCDDLPYSSFKIIKIDNAFHIMYMSYYVRISKEGKMIFDVYPRYKIKNKESFFRIINKMHNHYDKKIVINYNKESSDFLQILNQ